jgi:hypothetical protein
VLHHVFFLSIVLRGDVRLSVLSHRVVTSSSGGVSYMEIWSQRRLVLLLNTFFGRNLEGKSNPDKFVQRLSISNVDFVINLVSVLCRPVRDGTFPQNLRISPITPASEQKMVARCAFSPSPTFISPKPRSLDKTLNLFIVAFGKNESQASIFPVLSRSGLSPVVVR